MDSVTTTILCSLVLQVVSVQNEWACTPVWGRRVKEFDDKRISQSDTRVWTLTNQTKSHCLFQCYEDVFCVSVQYRQSGGVCRGFRQKFGGIGEVTTTDDPGNQLLLTDKEVVSIGQGCVEDSDCQIVPHSQCYNGICRCDIGYSPDGGQCRSLTECAVMGTVLSLHPGYVILGQDLATHHFYTRAQCIQACVDSVQCWSADYSHLIPACHLQTLTWNHVTATGRTSDRPDVDYYEKNCDTWQ